MGDEAGQREPVHGALRHVHVGHQQVDLLVAFEDGERLVGLRRFEDTEPRIDQGIGRLHQEKAVVFDHKDDLAGARRKSRKDHASCNANDLSMEEWFAG